MKKYLLLIGVSICAAGSVMAISAEDQLKTVKDLYLKEFKVMDANHDGQISQQEYLDYQFNTLRENIISADGFAAEEKPAEKATETTVKTEVENVESKANLTDNGIPAALHDMANFELEEDEPSEVTPLTKDDVMPEEDTSKASASETEESDELDLSMSEEENLKRLIEGVDAQSENKQEPSPLTQEEQISAMLDTIKKTLPKRIDEITTWTDITYNDGVINYIYQADIDTATYNEQELNVLKENIQKEACVKAYEDMCPRIKPMFIDNGIDMRIIYLDKSKADISSCEFNKTTCQN